MLDLAQGPFLVAVADGPQTLARAAELEVAQRSFDLVEARLDLYPNQSVDGCEAACHRLEASGTPVLITLRTAAQGGRWTGADAERLPKFRAALAVASWADVEDDAPIVEAVAGLLRARAGGQLVVSHHDFSRTPAPGELLALVDACHRAAPGALAKLATTIVHDGDRRALHDLIAKRPERTAVIGMGVADEGLRVALAAAGSLLAYGYLGTSTAPGQLSVAALHTRLLGASPRYAARRGARLT
ncbi:MAG TPA: type I 3-dehydroquinate dehydratase [Polyangia bacterium]|nr:type I 3-dehydroquinate dehydratase [Polyangia bacterium]